MTTNIDRVMKSVFEKMTAKFETPAEVKEAFLERFGYEAEGEYELLASGEFEIPADMKVKVEEDFLPEVEDETPTSAEKPVESTETPKPVETPKPAKKEKVIKIAKGPSKADQATAIFKEMNDKGSARKDIIEAFMTQLNMSKAGASTYYQNIKTKLATPAV
jgi:hypothetical protein